MVINTCGIALPFAQNVIQSGSYSDEMVDYLNICY